MTQAAIQQPPSPQQPAEPLPGQSPTEQQLILGLAALLAMGAAYEATSKQVVLLLAPLRLPKAAVTTAVRVAMSAPIGDATPPGAPIGGSGITTARLERTFRATFLYGSAKRIARQMREGKQPLEIIRVERAYFARHLEAQGKRRAAARAVDRAAASHGPVLGWYAKMDHRTTAECRWANGKNFEVGKRPPVGYPGTVHPNCRCKPGPPHPGAISMTSPPKRQAKARQA